MDTATPVLAATAGPVTARERIQSIDVMRGVALLGILAMNIQDFSMIGAAYMNPTAYGDLHGLNFSVWLVCALFADLKFMSIFSMLFGAGILLMTSRIEASGRRAGAIHYRRMGWLILFGCLHGYLLWSGDILVTYGLCGLLVYLSRKWKPRTLLVVGLFIVLVPIGLWVSSYLSMPYWPPSSVSQLNEHMWHPSAPSVAKELAIYRGGWLKEEPERIIQTAIMQTQGFFFLAFWRAYGLMLAGMGLFKLNVLNAKLPAKVYGWLIAAAVLAGLPIIGYGVYREFADGWPLGKGFFIDTQYNYVGSLLVSLGWIGLVMLACQKGWLRGAQARLAAVGRMAFTNYLVDTILCTFLFYGFGFGLFGKVSRVGQFGIVLVIWALQLIVSPIWLRHFQFGPFEWLWRSLTYWKIQPLRRTKSVMVGPAAVALET